MLFFYSAHHLTTLHGILICLGILVLLKKRKSKQKVFQRQDAPQEEQKQQNLTFRMAKLPPEMGHRFSCDAEEEHTRRAAQSNLKLSGLINRYLKMPNWLKQSIQVRWL